MSSERIRRSCKVTIFVLCFISLTKLISGFVNSPKIITKDGNLIFESGLNRNITFRLNGKSRITVNDQYDLLDLILRKRFRNSTSADVISDDISSNWIYGEENNLKQLISDVTGIKIRTFGSQGLENRLHTLQNRTNYINQSLRRYNTRLTRLQTRIQTLASRLELDSCKSNPCDNGGTCFNLYSGYMCKCTNNFEGQNCEKDVNECALFAGTDLGCQNGGQCVNHVGSYSCLCNPGWFGIHCSQRKGDCMQSSAWELCGHGTCVPAAGSDTFGYKCICEQGWRTNGLTPACTVDVDECTESHTPCLTKCINIPGSFTCAPCPVGLDGNGVNCRDIDECASNNGGCSTSPRVPCINTYGSYHCGECPLGWTGNGRICSRVSDTNENSGAIQSCRNTNVCYPGATCTEISNTVVCTCPAGMIGSGFGQNGCVATTSKNCASFPCLNGGTCIDNVSSYTCICPMGFHEPNCMLIPSPCISNPCRNNGECQPLGGISFKCQCAPGFSGRLCDGHFSRCGGVLAGLTGRLKYPEGSLYDHNSQCAWLLRTNETQVLNVTFNAFELEDSTECRFDWLQINDGRTAASQVIGRFCGTNKPNGGNIISSTNYLYLWFRSDNSTAKEGFEIEWNSIPPQCGGIVQVESHGTIATPGSPGNYPKNRDCIWRLRAPNNKRIKLTFFSLQIENHESCNYDFVEIKDTISGVLLEKYCNTSRPAPLLLPTNEATIHFHSDEEGADTGFQIYYSIEERVPGCGGTFTAKEGVIKSPVLQGEYMSCEYDIKLSKSESIIIEFAKFIMNADECIEIYGIVSEKQVSYLQSKYCGDYNFSPGILNTEYNEVQVKYFGKSGEFELHYKADCSLTFESNTGTIKSPGYPNITKGLTQMCTYKIITEPNTIISLNIADFDLRDSSLENNDCAFSYLRINDGPDRELLGPFCNDNQPPTNYVAKTNMVILLFQTGLTTLGKGFEIEYRALDKGLTNCGGVYTKPGYTIRLPTTEDGNYLHDLVCYFVIMAPQGKGIVLNWKSFNLETGYDCNYDYVEIFDNLGNSENGNALGRFCESRPPPSIASHSRILTIKFVSDYSDSAEGFEASYNFIDFSNNCGGHIFSSTGKIVSPGYPNNYTNELNCTWTITVPHGSQIELHVYMFELEPKHNGECNADWLEIRNGGSVNSTLIGKFCGTNIPKAIPSFTNQLRLNFYADHFVNARGFVITWSLLSNGCGGLLEADNGIISSPLYPQNYPNDALCEWRIHTHHGSSIQITVEDIDIEELFTCNYDYLEIMDGYKKYGKTVTKMCAMDDKKRVFETQSNDALIRFATDGSNTGRGFLLSFKTICNRTLTAMHGIIESPNFGTHDYYNDVSCVWTLQAPKGNKIVLEFTDFDKATHESIYLTENLKSGIKTKEIKEVGTYQSSESILYIQQNSSDVSFRLEYSMQGCINTFHLETGEFQSPNYPQTYPNDIECHWVIKVPFGKGIELTVELMDIEDSVNCTRDGLTILNEPTVDHPKERHCGKQKGFTISSSGHELFVRFYSDHQNNGKGFKASYRTINTTCGGILEAKNGAVSSPNYPLNYPQNVYCEWSIKVSPHHRIKLTVDDLDIERFYDCEMDYVTAYDTTISYEVYDTSTIDDIEEGEEGRLFQMCGQLDDYTDLSFVTEGNTALIRFNSDESNEYKGFKIHFEEICGEDIIITDEMSGSIELENHRQNNETCIWKLISKDVTKHVILTVYHAQLTQLESMTYKTEDECIKNGVQINEGADIYGPVRSKFCKVHPPAIISNGHALTISVPMNTISEFNADYMLMDNTCSGVYTAMTGKFSSPYYPNSYPVNIECEWVIEASEGNSIVLTFESMDLEQSDECNNDYVEIRESGPAGKLLGVYCGTSVPPPIVGQKYIWIMFRSDNDNVGTGFIASYNYAMHNELTGSNGIIESPKYPTKFYSREPFGYRITVDNNYVILLHVNHVVDVDMPSIKFYDGYSDIGAEIDYSQNHVIRSNTNVLYFTASRGPFEFEWERIGKDSIRANISEEENIKTCGNKLVVVDKTVVFTSPGWPHGYSNNMDCSWLLMPSNEASHVVLGFTKVDLEEFSDCFADYVKVSASSDLTEWKELDKKSCKVVPGNDFKFYHGTPYLKLDFHTDGSNNNTGFSSIVKTACGSQLHDQRGFVNITNLSGGINPIQMECIWTIHAKQGRRIRIRFEESTLHNPNVTSENCRSYFLVRNGIDEDSPFLGKGKYCENDISDILNTTSNRAYIKFVLVGYPKFKASFHYEEIKHECSDDLKLDEITQSSVTIKSPNYPNIANPHTECIWKITAPVHHIIAIHFFDKFDLTPGTGPVPQACDRELVQLNDGATELMPIIGRYCGNTKPDTLYTTGNILRVKYFTDIAEPRMGFIANVTIASCGGFYYDSEGVVNLHTNMVAHGDVKDTECIYTFEAAQDNIVRVDFSVTLPSAENCTTVTHFELQEIDSYNEVDTISDSKIVCGEINIGFLVETNKLVVRLRIKESFEFEKESVIKYKTLGSRCGQTIIASIGILQTPGYPNSVSRPTHCIWRIIGPKGKRIKIKFLDFDTGAGVNITSQSSIQPFLGRITFANDFYMQSIIARVVDNPPEFIYSTDNTLSIDAFLFSIGRHRGFKLYFNSEEESIICPHLNVLASHDVIRFRSNSTTDNYCSYTIATSTNQTVSMTIESFEQYDDPHLMGFLCEFFAPIKMKVNKERFMSSLFCKNLTIPFSIRFPYTLTLELLGSKRNKLSAVDIKLNYFECGGMTFMDSIDFGSNISITTPKMYSRYSGPLECAWAVWPTDTEDESDSSDIYSENWQLEISLSIQFKGKCEEEFLIVYNGKNQDSPQIGRYCGETAASNLIAESGIFIEYYTANYDTLSKFNVTAKQGSGCGGRLDYPYRTISFYDDYYKNNIECIWEITVEAGFNLNILFPKRFFIESSEGCKKDYLQIEHRSKIDESWQQLQRICGREPPKSITATGTEVRIIFRSDNDTVGNGFALKFERSCGGILYASKEVQNVKSPSFPAPMPNNLFCNYTVVPRNSIDEGILVHFDSFDMELSPLTNCIFDNVTVIEYLNSEKSEKVYCGIKKFLELRSEKRIEIIVRTDATFPSNGFSFYYSTNICGGVINNSTIIESPHQHSDGNFPPKSNCYWNITAPVGYKILIKLEELDYESQNDCLFDFVDVYKGSVPAADQRIGRFCGNMTGMIPIISISENKAIIKSESDERDASKGFRALISMIPNCDKHIFLGASNASYDFTDFSGKYDNNLDCSYVFKTEPGRQLQIDFNSFHIQEQPECAADFLQLYDGAGPFADEIGRFCGHITPTRLFSSRNSLLIRFVTDSRETSTGFAAQITSVPLICGNHNIVLESKKSSVLSSPQDPSGGYPKNVFCFWKIKAETTIHLKFTKLDIESKHENGTCGGDYIAIYNDEDASIVEKGYGDQVVLNGATKGVDYMNFATQHVYCGNFVPDDYYSNSKVIYIKFKTDGNGTGNGFSITATPAQGCYRNFTGTQGRIHIADTNDHCDLQLKAPTNYSLSIYFSTISFNEYNCDLEYIEVFDASTNKSLNKYCQYIDPGKSVFTNSNELRLRIKMNTQYTEFDMTYLASPDGPGCGGNLYNTQGLFTSPYYPENVRNNSDCRWNVRVPSNLRVFLRFETFNLGAMATCFSDYVQIIEVNSRGQQQVMRHFCGGDSPNVYKSKINLVTVRFHKTVNFDGTGFVIRFNGVYSNYIIPSYYG